MTAEVLTLVSGVALLVVFVLVRKLNARRESDDQGEGQQEEPP